MAEDLVHEGCLKVLKKYGATPDKPLLFRVIRNLYIDDFRHRQKFPADPIDEIELADHLALDPVAHASTDHRLAAALLTLRDAEREALFLWVFEGYTAAEIGKLNNQSRSTILSLIHRAKAKLRLQLESTATTQLRVVGNRRSDS